MTEKLKGVLKNKNNLIVIVLLGVLLLVIAIPVDKKEKVKENDQTSQNSAGGNPAGGEAEQSEAEAYCAYMEEKLEKILSQVDGAGKVQVIISVKGTGERVVEKDHPVSRSGTQEKDSQGGNREVSTVDSGESTVFVTASGKSEPYLVQVLQPEVEGVVVLAQGAGTGSVSKDIAEMIQVLFGIEAHKVAIVKMEDKSV
ncbi:MAG: stage III sporulation protein AG [Lachnospiraceae bacterium]|nr:stage III sporulation protein AG [Lachnospiraceae bacterium]